MRKISFVLNESLLTLLHHFVLNLFWLSLVVHLTFFLHHIQPLPFSFSELLLFLFMVLNTVLGMVLPNELESDVRLFRGEARLDVLVLQFELNELCLVISVVIEVEPVVQVL
jgi:hypothetical protein